MKKKEEYGKMPFRVPEHFFEEMEGQLLRRASETEMTPEKSEENLKMAPEKVEPIQVVPAGPRRRHVLQWSLGAAAALFLIAGGLFLYGDRAEKLPAAPESLDLLYTYNPDMSTAEMEGMADLIGSDIFLLMDGE